MVRLCCKPAKRSGIRPGEKITVVRLVSPFYNPLCYPQKKGGKYNMKFIKIIAVVAFAASALSLGACASKTETATTTGASTTGMSK